jgi:preprotein translocase subunit SecD
VGFAKTLIIGVVRSMSVMLLLSRLLMKSLVPMGAVNPALYGVKNGNKEEN